MAGTTTKSRETGYAGSDVRDLIIQHNNAVTDLELLRATSSAGGVVAVTELMEDHATFKAAVDATETLVEELHDDHATFKAALDATETLIEELHDDHATNKTLMDELKTDYTALLADVTAIRNAVLAITAKLDADAGVTDTNYAATTNPAALTATAIAASSAATLTASKPPSGPATLTASKPPSGPATLTASVPTGTSIDTAGDLIAAKIGDASGTVITA